MYKRYLKYTWRKGKKKGVSRIRMHPLYGWSD